MFSRRGITPFQAAKGYVDYVYDRDLGACARFAFRGLSCWQVPVIVILSVLKGLITHSLT